MKDFLDDFPKLLALSTFVVLALSVVHEWGYFGVVGWHFHTLMTPYDYLVAAVGWLPIMVLGWIVLAIIEHLTDPEGHARRRRKKYWVHIFGILMVIPAVLGFFFGPPEGGEFTIAYFAAFAYLWSLVCVYGLARLKLEKSVLIVVLVAPILLALAFSNGVFEGYRNLRAATPVYMVRTDRDNDDRKVVVWRNLDKGVLGRNMVADRIEFYKWADIKLFSAVVPPPEYRSHGCRIFGWYCLKDRASPSG